MEKNTVLIDLDRYEKLIKEHSIAVERYSSMESTLKDNYFLPKKHVGIKEEDRLSLVIKVEALENIVNEIEGYRTTKSHYDDTEISSYALKIEKVVVL